MVGTVALPKLDGPERHAPALLLFVVAAIVALLPATPAGAQQRQASPAQQRQQQAPAQQQARPVRPVAIPLPDPQSTAKLVWSTIAAVDHANKTGNYSVLRDLGTGSFQSSNNAAGLAAVFANIRQQRLDLSNTLLIAPAYEFAPALVQPGLLRIRGSFPMRPTGLLFDLLFQWEDGWRLEGIALMPQAMAIQPTPR